MEKIRIDYDQLREFLQRSETKTYLSIADARANALRLDWVPPTTPKNLEPTLKDFPLDRLIPYIDWTPFSLLVLHGKYPEILSDSVVGIQATELFSDAK